jgi:hypothetical protein
MVCYKCDDELPNRGNRPLAQKEASVGELAGARVAGGRREDKRVPRVREEGRKKGYTEAARANVPSARRADATPGVPMLHGRRADATPMRMRM